MFLPWLIPNEINGILGLILEPEFTTKHGIFPSNSAVLVNNAGVGIPSGVAGTPEIEKHFP
jgi:hypothetical protein